MTECAEYQFSRWKKPIGLDTEALAGVDASEPLLQGGEYGGVVHRKESDSAKRG